MALQGSSAAQRRRDPHVAIVECDVGQPIPRVPPSDDRGVAWTSAEVLVRVFTEPIGVLRLPVGADGVDPQRLAAAIVEHLGPAVAARVTGAGARWEGQVPLSGIRPVTRPPYLAARDRVLDVGPDITAAICTADRPFGLERVLESLVGQVYPRLSVLVVDNAPDDPATRRVAAKLADRLELSYVVEHRPGLSWARNRSIAASSSEVIAWIDDDEACDPWWPAELARGFVEHPDAGAVCGRILPGEIETRAQQWFEHFGGHNKGRDFSAAVFSPATRTRQSPLYPLPPFGTGGNMAFRRDALRRIGGFDCALGAGTATRAGEDTAALSTLLYLGGTAMYQPTAIVRHWHRRAHSDLRGLLHNYGRGLGAFYTSMVLRYPTSALELLRLAPSALRDFASPRGARLGQIGDAFPEDLLRAELRGLVEGPVRYAQARASARRLRRTVPREPARA